MHNTNLPHVNAGVWNDLIQISDMPDTWWINCWTCLKFLSRNCQYCTSDGFLNFILCAWICICVVFKNSPHIKGMWYQTGWKIYRPQKTTNYSVPKNVTPPHWMNLYFFSYHIDLKKKNVEFVQCVFLNLVPKNSMGPVFLVGLTARHTSIFMSCNRTSCISLLICAKQLQVRL